MRGAQELNPDQPFQDVVPLDETSPFQPNSTLSSFWTIMHTSPAKDNTFYFVRKRGGTQVLVVFSVVHDMNRGV
jgi:hypothetical protein